MEQKIIEILEEMEDQFEITGYYGSFAGYGIKRTDYQKLAERIVKLFAIPDVIDTVCDCSIEDFNPDWEKNECKNCGKIIEY